ncbi:alpha/beta fold hydrolase [Kineosporia sp. A_224]|uniref:lipase family alpha/beta hydrolase n=1 Tax=Kineosporia sp. A_224 TaxID=1962180 RepID=UPI000B4B9836|nr:alpha/beta fold hydrolase [Kineosporia sp. A_224]
MSFRGQRIRATALALAATLVGAGAAGCGGGSSGGTASAPVSAPATGAPTGAPTATRTGVDQAVSGTVLLVPGYGGNVRDLDALRDLLRSRGRTVVEVETPGSGTGDLRGQAAAVATAATQAVAAGAPSVDVVGYSAGGVVARIFVAEQGGAAVVRRVVTIGSPHHGTQVALLVNGTECPDACRQLRPASDLLTDLPEPPVADGAQGPVFTSLWSASDEVIAPPTSSVLEGTLSIRLQDVCADDATTHTMLPRTPLVGGLVLRALADEPLRAAPAPDECETVRTRG